MLLLPWQYEKAKHQDSSRTARARSIVAVLQLLTHLIEHHKIRLLQENRQLKHVRLTTDIFCEQKLTSWYQCCLGKDLHTETVKKQGQHTHKSSISHPQEHHYCKTKEDKQVTE